MKTSTQIGIEYFNKEVRVYRNLTKKCWSIQHKTEKGWRVLDHCESITLANATFRVYESGRDRVRKERKKYVHAYVYGTIVEPSHIFWTEWKANKIETNVRYNPYVNDTFVYDNGRRASGTHLALLDSLGVVVSK